MLTPRKPDTRVVLVCRSGGDYSPDHVHWLARQLLDRATVLTDFPADKARFIPSTGFLVILWLLENGAKKMTLAGFDHFSRAATGQHHYWDVRAFIAPPEHDGDAETRLLLPLVESGRLAYLR